MARRARRRAPGRGLGRAIADLLDRGPADPRRRSPRSSPAPASRSPGAKGVPRLHDRPSSRHAVTARPEHIDELGHVNNAVWVQWIQEVALAHWYSVADPAHQDDYIWVVVRHEIDYLRAAFDGETLTGRTWVGEAPKGARFDRHMEFVGEDGKVRVRARHPMGDHRQGQPAGPIRVPPEVVAPFHGSEALRSMTP